MIENLFATLGRNYATKPSQTLATALGLFVAVLVVWLFLALAIGIGLFGLVIALAIVAVAAWYTPQLAWFWGRDIPAASQQEEQATSHTSTDSIHADDADNEFEHIPVPDPQSILNGQTPKTFGPIIEVPRSTPEGTELVLQTADKAVLKIKAVVRVWGRTVPLILTLLSVPAIPAGGVFGGWYYSTFIFNGRRYIDSSPYIFWWTILLPAIFIIFAVWTYFHYRRWVRVEITHDFIQFGPKTFDRRYTEGMRVGYKTDEADLRSKSTDDYFGVSRLRLSYGPWGEDLDYLVNTYHAEEIVIWMNGIIDRVGAPPPPSSDPYSGRKIELL